MELFNKEHLESIGKNLKKKKETIAIAESVTSGLLQFAFSTIFEAAKFFQGGITAYNIGQKVRQLHIEPIHAQEVNCVSDKVSTEMALDVAREFTSDWAIAITGYATPVPESGNKIFAYYAIAYKGQIKDSGKISLPKSDPTEIQVEYVNKIIEKFSTLIWQ